MEKKKSCKKGQYEQIVKIINISSEIEKGFSRLIERGEISYEAGDRYNMMLFELDELYIDYVNRYGELGAIRDAVQRAAEINDIYLELLGIDNCVGRMY